MMRMRRKVTGVITTPANREESDNLVAAVQTILNTIASNKDIEGENIVLFWSYYSKAPDEIAELLSVVMNEKEAGVFKIGALVAKVRSKIKGNE